MCGAFTQQNPAHFFGGIEWAEIGGQAPGPPISADGSSRIWQQIFNLDLIVNTP